MTLFAIGHIPLQVVRAFNVIALLYAALASGILIGAVNTSTPFFFFEAASLVGNILVCFFLIPTELPFIPFLKKYFRKNWPVLAEEHGHLWTGVCMWFIGCRVLGSYDQPMHEHQPLLGKHFTKIVFSSGIVVFAMGVINTLCGIIFRSGSLGISSRFVRDHGATAVIDKEDAASRSSSEGAPSPEEMAELLRRNSNLTARPARVHRPGQNARDVENVAGLEVVNAAEGAPQAAQAVQPPEAVQAARAAQAAQAQRDEAAADNNAEAQGEEAENDPDASPIVPGVRRPDIAHHPINANGQPPHYSVVDMERF